MGVPQNRCFTIENPIYKWMTWGYPYFRKPPYSCCMLLQYIRCGDDKYQLIHWPTDQRMSGGDSTCTLFFRTGAHAPFRETCLKVSFRKDIDAIEEKLPARKVLRENGMA